MIVLLDTSDTLEKCQSDLGPDFSVGQLVTPLTRRSNLGVTWALDNGAYSRFDGDEFLRILARDEKHRERCLFVAVPDVVGSARRTMEVFERWKCRIGAWPAALVAQDGIGEIGVPWDEIQAIFIGGSTRFKTSDEAMAVAKAAKALGKWVHVGRVNTSERLDWWSDVADSIDGTGVARYTHMRRGLTSPTAPLFREEAACPTE